MIELTYHAIVRAKKRLNLNHRDLKKKATLSITDGVDVFADPVFRPIFLKKIEKHPETSGIYYFEGIFFFFSDNFLTTVYPLSYLNEYKQE